MLFALFGVFSEASLDPVRYTSCSQSSRENIRIWQVDQIVA